MTTAVDASVLLDVVLDDPRYRDRSLRALKAERRRGGLIVCPIVWAQVFSSARDPETLGPLLERAGLAYDPFDRACADLAGRLFKHYRRVAGPRRSHALSDFMVGAHALTRGARLLSRDRAFYLRFFDGLQVVEPAGVGTGGES